jgi:DNA-directed RNA polymerase specialized sigma24 family protein
MSELTYLLEALEQGDSQAAEQLLPLVYDELRKLAAKKMANERPGQTLEATALVHEAYLRLIHVKRPQRWSSRGRHAADPDQNTRAKACEKRGGQWRHVDLEGLYPTTSVTPDQLIALDDGLGRLSALDQLA